MKSADDRFWPKVNKTDGCWLWTGAIVSGYGQFRFMGRVVYAHRYTYETMVSEIPDGLQIDHLCRIRNCVNPSHLEVVTCRENLLRGEGVAAINARKTHCPKGHRLAGMNLDVGRLKRGERLCRICRNGNARRWRMRTN